MIKENNRSSMPKPMAIMEYWIDRFAKQGMYDIVSTDVDDMPSNACFACGCPSNIERAHITALIDGGTNELDNLHLLCRACHSESECYDGEAYDKWFYWKLEQPSWLAQKLKMMADTGQMETHPLYGKCDGDVK